MPGRDGTGPLGAGPLTGRGMGWCGQPGTGRGQGRGVGRGFGRGVCRMALGAGVIAPIVAAVMAELKKNSTTDAQ